MAATYFPSLEADQLSIQSVLVVSRVTFLSFTFTLYRRTGAACSASSTISESSFLRFSSCSYHAGSSSALKMMVSLSSQSIRRGARASSVSVQGSPPCGLISQICTGAVSGFAPYRARLVVNAISCPSGDHCGWPLLSLPRVSWISLLSLKLESIRFETVASLSLSPVDFTHTSHLPSGEMRNGPARSAKIMSSGFHGSIFAVDAADFASSAGAPTSGCARNASAHRLGNRLVKRREFVRIKDPQSNSNGRKNRSAAHDGKSESII